MSTSIISRKSAALELAAEGFHVFPAVEGTKRPDGRLVPHGFKDATRDPATITAWWDRYPNNNIGIAVGPKYGLIVLDVDCKNGQRGFETLERLKIDLESTRVARTPSGGLHIYFKHPGCPLPNTLDGIEIRGANSESCVLAPPSTLTELCPRKNPRGGSPYGWAP